MHIDTTFFAYTKMNCLGYESTIWMPYFTHNYNRLNISFVIHTLHRKLSLLVYNGLLKTPQIPAVSQSTKLIFIMSTVISFSLKNEVNSEVLPVFYSLRLLNSLIIVIHGTNRKYLKSSVI